MINWYEEPKVIKNGKECPFVIHKNVLPGPILCARAHAHDYIEMLYCLEGTHEILLDRKSYTFTPGDMVLISSNEVHQIQAVSKETSCYIVVRFEPEILYTTIKNAFELKYILPFAFHKTMPQKVFKKDEICDTFIPELFNELLDDYTSQPYCYDFAIYTNIYRIFLWILRYWNKNYNTLSPITVDEDIIAQIQPALDYIDNNYDEDITAATMAELCHLSYSYFSRMFKKVVQKNFREYLNYIRITKSEILLATTTLSVTDIALKCGFSTSSYFIQQFKLYKKISPKQFRKKFVLAEI